MGTMTSLFSHRTVNSRRQAQVSIGGPWDPHLIFSLNLTVWALCLLLSVFYCYSYILKEAGRVHLSCGETKILECKRHHFLFLETKPAGREGKWFVSW